MEPSQEKLIREGLKTPGLDGNTWGGGWEVPDPERISRAAGKVAGSRYQRTDWPSRS